MKDILFWLTPKEVSKVYTSKYWNDEMEETQKAWYIKDSNDQKLFNHLNEYDLISQFEASEKYIDDLEPFKKNLITAKKI